LLKISFWAPFYCAFKVNIVPRVFPKRNISFYYHFSTLWDRHLPILCVCVRAHACMCRNILIENITGWDILRPAINPFLHTHKFKFCKRWLPDHPVAVLWKLGCIWPTLQESVTAVSLIRRRHWCWQFVCLTDCSHCLESSPVTDTNSLYYFHVSHGFVLLQCSQTAATICKAHLHSLLSGLPTLIYLIFVLTRGPLDMYSFQNFIIENALHLCKDLWKWSIRENTNSGFHKKWSPSHNLASSII